MNHSKIKKLKEKRHTNNNMNMHICIRSYARYYHPAAVLVCASCKVMECAHTDKMMYRGLHNVNIYLCTYMSIMEIAECG